MVNAGLRTIPDGGISESSTTDGYEKQRSQVMEDQMSIGARTEKAFDRREGERRNGNDRNYTGPERRDGERRQGDRRQRERRRRV